LRNRAREESATGARALHRNSYTYVTDLPSLTRSWRLRRSRPGSKPTCGHRRRGSDELYKETDAVARIRKGCWDTWCFRSKASSMAMSAARRETLRRVLLGSPRVRQGKSALVVRRQFCSCHGPEKTCPSTRLLVAAFDKMSKETGARLAPVGPAMGKSAQERPAINSASGRRLASSLAGSYLAACVSRISLAGVLRAWRPGMSPAAACSCNECWRTSQEGR